MSPSRPSAPPPPAALATIQRHLLRRAWARFQTSSTTLTRRWSDPVLGDPAFATARLQPAVADLTALGDRLPQADALPPAELAALYQQAAGLMFEFPYHVAALRRAYLTERLTTPPERP
jgi:hypothetical protein